MPDPYLIEVAVSPKMRTDWDKLVRALDALAVDDRSFELSVDSESLRIVLKGTSETQLDLLITALQRSSGMAVDLGAPQVAYRETLQRRVETVYTHNRQIDGRRQFARVRIVFEPNEARSGSAFESKIVGGAVPTDYLLGVERGISSVMSSGILAGFPLVDVKATLIDGAFHDVDSSVLAFEIASRAAFREALREGGSLLLEPIMAVAILIPEDGIGFVTSDLRVRRGTIQGLEPRDTATLINALVPLANTFGYDNQLRAGTKGCGTFTMGFSHYAVVPRRPDDDGPAAPALALRR